MIPTNSLYFGDNLDFLRNRDYFPSESVDLIYLDPPFNSNQSYNILYRDVGGTPSSAQVKAFGDTWRWDETAAKALHQINTDLDYAPQSLIGLINSLSEFIGHSPMYAYLVQMAVRLVELHRILKQTGTLFLHCDSTASHYLKIMLDQIFQPVNFIREIVWAYGTPSGGRVGGAKPVKGHDIILTYAKHYGQHTYNKLYLPYSEKYLRERFIHTDEDGRRYRTRKRKDIVTKQYLDESKGVPLSDTWTDIKQLYAYHLIKRQQEDLGFQTQKPRDLLERIIRMSGKPGYIVLDPFCGCGTTIDAVVSINSENPDEPQLEWIGIDITHLAIDLIKSRLATRFNLDRQHYDVIGEPTTIEEARSLALEDRYQFQYWALGLIGARPWGQKKKGADKGIDGYRTYLHGDDRSYKKCLVQVKSGKVGSPLIRDLKGTMDRENGDMGVFITLEQPTSAMLSEVASAGYYHSEIMNRDYPCMQILTIEQLLRDPDCFKIPPGGQIRAAPILTKEKNQNNFFD
ncbi:MAG: DNA methyltransferase [Candidatus Hatepunaea meridiana]|nr:DNA methyltransferase [Candidatus Hatepunaea meridiana]